MRVRPIVCMALVGALSATGGAAAGYAFGSSELNPSAEAAGISGGTIHYVAGSSATPSALRQAPPSAYQEFYQSTDVESQPRYMLGIDNELVAVFYAQDGILRLKERTNTPAYSLSFDERARLEGGIRIYTDEQLMRALQDYGS